MMTAVKSFLFLTMLAMASAQIPSLGWCPDYQAMPSFNLNKFLGTWHEAERYFTITELGSRCVTTSYEKLSDGRIIVHNEIKSALTGVKRVLDGQLQYVGRDGEGKLAVKYLSLPVPYDTQYTILDTDYDTFAVMWSCSGIGPVHTQNAWVMTRDRIPPGLVLQRAYGVLDKFKISRAFFVKTGQDDCTLQPAPIDVIDPVKAPVVAPVAPAAEVVKANSEVVNEQIAEEAPKEEEKEEAIPEVKVDPEVKPEEPIPQVKSPLPVAELIIANAEKAVEPPIVEQNENVVENSNPEVPAVKSIDPVIPEPENPSKPAEAPVEPTPVQSEQSIKSVVNEIANEEPSKIVVEQSDPKPVEQIPEQEKA